jgi:hypothetical protein
MTSLRSSRRFANIWTLGRSVIPAIMQVATRSLLLTQLDPTEYGVVNNYARPDANVSRCESRTPSHEQIHAQTGELCGKLRLSLSPRPRVYRYSIAKFRPLIQPNWWRDSSNAVIPQPPNYRQRQFCPRSTTGPGDAGDCRDRFQGPRPTHHHRQQARRRGNARCCRHYDGKTRRLYARHGRQHHRPCPANAEGGLRPLQRLHIYAAVCRLSRWRHGENGLTFQELGRRHCVRQGQSWRCHLWYAGPWHQCASRHGARCSATPESN